MDKPRVEPTLDIEDEVTNQTRYLGVLVANIEKPIVAYIFPVEIHIIIWRTCNDLNG